MTPVGNGTTVKRRGWTGWAADASGAKQHKKDFNLPFCTSSNTPQIVDRINHEGQSSPTFSTWLPYTYPQPTHIIYSIPLEPNQKSHRPATFYLQKRRGGGSTGIPPVVNAGASCALKSAGLMASSSVCHLFITSGGTAEAPAASDEGRAKGGGGAFKLHFNYMTAVQLKADTNVPGLYVFSSELKQQHDVENVFPYKRERRTRKGRCLFPSKLSRWENVHTVETWGSSTRKTCL